MAEIAATTGDAHQLLNEINPRIKAIAESGSRISADTEQMVARLKAGEGTLSKLINDDTLYRLWIICVR